MAFIFASATHFPYLTKLYNIFRCTSQANIPPTPFSDGVEFMFNFTFLWLAINSSLLILSNVHRFCGFIVCISSSSLMKTLIRDGTKADPSQIPSQFEKMVYNYCLNAILKWFDFSNVFSSACQCERLCKCQDLSATSLCVPSSCSQRRKLD